MNEDAIIAVLALFTTVMTTVLGIVVKIASNWGTVRSQLGTVVEHVKGLDERVTYLERRRTR